MDTAAITGIFSTVTLSGALYALATLIARISEVVICLISALRCKHLPFEPAAFCRPGADMLRRFLRYSAPVVLNEAAWGTGTSLITVILGHAVMSVELLAAHAVMGNMNRLLQEKCHIGNTTIMVPVSTYCTGTIMIVVDDRSKFENITEQSAEICKAAGISFCTVLSDRSLYDLTEQKEKELTYIWEKA